MSNSSKDFCTLLIDYRENKKLDTRIEINKLLDDYVDLSIKEYTLVKNPRTVDKKLPDAKTVRDKLMEDIEHIYSKYVYVYVHGIRINSTKSRTPRDRLKSVLILFREAAINDHLKSQIPLAPEAPSITNLLVKRDSTILSIPPLQ